MADGSTAFAHKAGDKVAIKDGKHTRVGFVVAQEEATGTHPAGYSIIFKMKETNQNRVVRWAANDLVAAPSEDAFAFKLKDKVVVMGADGEPGQSGEVVERAPVTQDTLEPQYAVQFKDERGRTQLAWWGEAILSAA